MKWIDFSKEQPLDGQRVIYYFEVTGSNIGYFEAPNTFYSGRGWLEGDVTHWMPMIDDPPITCPNLKKYLEEKGKNNG